jgi:hypothetical protein
VNPAPPSPGRGVPAVQPGRRGEERKEEKKQEKKDEKERERRR